MSMIYDVTFVLWLITSITVYFTHEKNFYILLLKKTYIKHFYIQLLKEISKNGIVICSKIYNLMLLLSKN